MPNQIQNLEYWIQRTIPQVYDDSMSFYELLNKVVEKLNEVVTSTNDLLSQDFQTFTENILIKWKDDGTLDNIINQTVFNELNGEIDVLKNKKITWKSIKEYGCVGDGVTDDTANLQTALNDGGLLVVPIGRYRVTNTLEIPETVVLKGLGYSIDDQLDNASVIFFDNVIEGKALFHSSKPNSVFEDMYFEGKNFSSDRRLWSKCFIFDKGTVYGDTDIDFKGCHFKRFQTSIELQGRGLHVTDCAFEEQWKPIVLKHFNNDEVTNPPTYDWQTNIRGFRKFHFVNNLFHSVQGYAVSCMSTSSNNYEKHIHQVVFTGNRLDGTGGLWEGYIGGATVSGNTIGNVNSGVYGLESRIFELYGAKSLTVTGNTISSYLDKSTIKDINWHVGDIFAFNTGGVFENITVIGNTLTNLGKRIVMAFESVSKFTFSQNIIDGVLLEKIDPLESAFKFFNLGSYITIKDNIFKDTGGVLHNLLANFVNRGVLNCSIEGNVFLTSEFAVSHNLYNYNMQSNVLMNNYTGDGAAEQVLTFKSPVLFVIITEYGTPKTIMKRAGTSNGNTLVEIIDNTVKVKGVYNTSAIAYSIVAYTV